MKGILKISKWINIDYNYFNLKMFLRNKLMLLFFVNILEILTLIFIATILDVNKYIFLGILIINFISMIAFDKIKDSIDKEMDLFGDYLEYKLTGDLSYKLLESKIKKIDANKFHISRELNERGYIKHWAIYEKEDLFNIENKPILDSNKNNLLDLENFINKLKSNAIISPTVSKLKKG